MLSACEVEEVAGGGKLSEAVSRSLRRVRKVGRGRKGRVSNGRISEIARRLRRRIGIKGASGR